MTKTEPAAKWKSSFGDEYTLRNEFAEWKVAEGAQVFERIIGSRRLTSVLEVGANLGINLAAMAKLSGGAWELHGLEPNPTAYRALTSNPALKLAGAYNCDAYSIPLPDSSIDLGFTCGVLIHIPPERLSNALSELYRVSRRYLLCIEYFSHNPEALPYRGEMGLLFKRDFGAFYLDQFPALKVCSYGFIWQREFKHYDNLNWWLFEK